MRSVLVCVRTALAAQAIATCATRLGFGEVIHTAVGGADALARIDDTPADLLLVDTASVRPDTVDFTRRVRQVSPAAAVVFFGPEDPATARAAVALGARGVIRGGSHEDLVTSVAKALMLLLRPARVEEAARAVPLQRSEDENTDASVVEAEAAPPQSASPAAPAPIPGAPAGLAPAGHAGVDSTPADLAAAAVAAVGLGRRRPGLTERELQVLRGMADGKSNAEIGRELFVSEDTVKTHARRLFRKLEARDRAHAVAAAFRAGIVS